MRIKRPQTRAGDGLTKTKAVATKRSPQKLVVSTASSRKKPAARSPKTKSKQPNDTAPLVSTASCSSSGGGKSDSGRKDPPEPKPIIIPVAAAKNQISRPPKKLGAKVAAAAANDRKPSPPIKDVISKELKNLDIQITGYTEQVGSNNGGVKASISEIVKTKSRTASSATQNVLKQQLPKVGSVSSSSSSKLAVAATTKEDVVVAGDDVVVDKILEDGAAILSGNKTKSDNLVVTDNAPPAPAKQNVSTLKKVKSLINSPAKKQIVVGKSKKVSVTRKTPIKKTKEAKLPKKEGDKAEEIAQKTESNDKIIPATAAELDQTLLVAVAPPPLPSLNEPMEVTCVSVETSLKSTVKATTTTTAAKKTKNSDILKSKLKLIDKVKLTAPPPALKLLNKTHNKRPIELVTSNCFSHSESPDSAASPVQGHPVKQKKIKKSHTIIKKMVEDILEGLEMSDEISSSDKINSTNASADKLEELPIVTADKEPKDLISVKDIQTMIATPVVSAAPIESASIVKTEEKSLISNESDLTTSVTENFGSESAVVIKSKPAQKRTTKRPPKKVVAKSKSVKSSDAKSEKDIFDFRESGHSSEDTCLSYLKNIKKESTNVMDEKSIEEFAAKTKKRTSQSNKQKKSVATKAKPRSTTKTAPLKKQDSSESSSSDESDAKIVAKKGKRTRSTTSTSDDDSTASEDTNASKSAGGTRINKRRIAAVKNRRLKLFGFYSGPKRHRMASLNALAKVQCLYENESRTAQELGFVREPRAVPKVKVAAAAVVSTVQTVAAAAAADVEPPKSNEKSRVEIKPPKPIEPSASKVVSRNLRTDPGLRGPGKLWEMGNMSSMDSDTAPETDESYDEVCFLFLRSQKYI